MVYSSDMSGGSMHESYNALEPTDEGDVIDHPAHNLPLSMQPARPDGIKMAGDVIPFPADKATIMPNTTAVRNSIAKSYMERTGIPASSKVIDIGPRLK